MKIGGNVAKGRAKAVLKAQLDTSSGSGAIEQNTQGFPMLPHFH